MIKISGAGRFLPIFYTNCIIGGLVVSFAGGEHGSPPCSGGWSVAVLDWASGHFWHLAH